MKPDAVPRVGAYWFSKDMSERVYFCGMNAAGDLLYEDQDGDVFMYLESQFRTWRHVPECTSFKWQPEVWPEWYVHENKLNRFYVRRDSEQSYEWINDRGESGHGSWTRENDSVVRDGRWLLVTESEALSRIVKPVEVVPTCTMCNGPADLTDDSCKACHELTMAKITQPAEDPDEWVTQDRVPVRVGMDEAQYVKPGRSVDPFAWKIALEEECWNGEGVHGLIAHDGDCLHVRCRRRDLPPLPVPEPPKPATRTVTLYEWVVWTVEGTENIDWWTKEPVEWPNRFCTQNTRTIEVPI